MRRTRAVLAGLALAAFPAVVMATDQNINLTAAVPKFCKFNAVPTFGSLNNVTVGSSSTSASVINVSTATNSTGIMNNAGFSFSIQSTCNTSSQVVLTTLNGGLKDATPEPVVSGTFLNRIDYLATTNWAGAPIGIFSTNGTVMASSSPQLATGAHTGLLSMNFGFILNTSAPLAAGDYTDTLRISLTPQ